MSSWIHCCVIVLIFWYVLLANIYDQLLPFPYLHMILSTLHLCVLISHRSMDCTAYLVIDHMYVQYIKASTDWVVPQSVRQYHYGFPFKKVLVVQLAANLDNACLSHATAAVLTLTE